MTLKGRWHYLEQDWWAEQGSFSFEPPGETHTLEVPGGCEEMCTLFHVIGAYVYVDPDGKAEKVEDVFSEIKLTRDHYEKVGLGKDFVSTCCLPPCCLLPSLPPAPRRMLSETLNMVLQWGGMSGLPALPASFGGIIIISAAF